MNDLGATQEEIGCAGCQVFLTMHGGKATDSLTFLRYSKVMEMMSNRKVLEPGRLPITERAAFFGNLRVHYQEVVYRRKFQKISWTLWNEAGSFKEML